MVAFRDIRREAIEGHPDAFGARLSDEIAHDEDWYRDKLEAEHVYGGFGQDGYMLGTAALNRRRMVAALSGMNVRPGGRRKGLARLLLDAAVSEAFRDCEAILLAVAVMNKPAIRLYVSAGFRQWEDDANLLNLKTVSSQEMLMRLDRV